MPDVLERIELILEGDADPSSQPDEMEALLTHGYARALELELESAKAEEQIAELAARVDDASAAQELRHVAVGRGTIESQLARLREALVELHARVEHAAGRE